jgi:hypothetical protein
MRPPLRLPVKGHPLELSRTQAAISVSTSRIGGRIEWVVGAPLYLVPPLCYLVFEHLNQASRLMKLVMRTIEFRFKTFYLRGSRALLIIHPLFYERDILELLRLKL